MNVFIICIILLIIYVIIEQTIVDSNEKWWNTKGKDNFPFKWKGKTLWYSRSVAVTNFVFGKNAEGVWHVLANKRGNGTPDYQGYWNVPCGYLNFSECGEEAAIRETFEETGLDLKEYLHKIQMCGVSTSPSNNRQNVSIRYKIVLEEPIENYSKFSRKFMEKDEVDEIKWIPIIDVKNYEWAFGHNAYIDSIFSSIN